MPFLLLLLHIPFAATEYCGGALGLETGAIRDTQLSASSSFDQLSVGPSHSRYHLICRAVTMLVDGFMNGNEEKEGGAWCPKGQINPESSEYLEVDLGAPFLITAIETQGRFGAGHGKEYAPAYKIHYWRPRLEGWVAYRTQDGNELINGNSNTFTPVLRELTSAIVASKIRIVPYSEFTRTVCLRLELYGCPRPEGIVSYSVSPLPGAGGLGSDWSFDGTRKEEELKEGLGILTDGLIPEENFHKDPHRWVSWKQGGRVTVTLELPGRREVDSLNIFTSSQGFDLARIAFSDTLGHFPRGVVDFHYLEQRSRDEGEWVKIPLGGRAARYLRIQLSFSQDWLLLGEITLNSYPYKEGNNTERNSMPVALVFPDDDIRQETIAMFTLDDMPIGYLALIIVSVSGLVIAFIYVRQRKLTSEAYSAVYAGLATLARNGQARHLDFARTLEAAKEKREFRLTVNPIESVGASNSSFFAHINNMENSLLEKLPSPNREKVHPFAPSPPNRPLPTSPPPAYLSEAEDSSEYAEAEAPLLSTVSCSTTQLRLIDGDSLHYASSDLSSLNLQRHLTRTLKGTLSRSKYSVVEVGASTIALVQIPRHRLHFLEKLGQGQFGEVHRCQLQTQEGRLEVAVKALRPTMDSQLLQDFDKELRVLSKLSHRNVVGLVGMCSGEEPRLMVLEYVSGGDLHQYLQNYGAGLRSAELVRIAGEIACGMAYLESLNFVHRDLATRNCLISEDGGEVKIGDFGMARSLYSQNYYKIEGNVVLPIRWMAPEALLLGKFTRWTDVWAMGVTLWEIWTLGLLQPFADLDDAAIVQNAQACYYTGRLQIWTLGLLQPFADLDDAAIVQNAQACYYTGCLQVCLGRPSGCSQEMYDLMLSCWKRVQEERPTFADIHLFLRRRLTSQ